MKSRLRALVTGASSGIGAVFAQRLAARGYDLVVTARRVDRLEALADTLRAAHGVEVAVVAADLEHPEGPATLLSALDADAREIDLLINNAGFGFQGDLVAMPPEKACAMIDLNIKALTLLTMHFAKVFADRGRGGIINVGSIQSFQPMPHYAVYGASKAYVLSLSNALAEELRPHGVTVLALCPGLTESEFHSALGRTTTAPGWMIQSAEDCVDACLEAYNANATTLVPRWNNKLTAQLHRVLPRRLVTRLMGSVIARSYRDL